MQAKIVSLQEEVNSLTEAQLENVRLRKLLGMKEDMEQKWQMIPANIIARDTENWFRSVTIDRGTVDGLKKDLVVINQDGLVGRVISVTRNTAEVLLILDREGAVGCLVQLTRTPGIVEGLGTSGLLRMIDFPYDAEVKENQVVLTSGLGGVYPSGLRIGFITQVKLEPNGLMKQAIVKSFVDFNRLEEVLVLIKPINEVHVP